MSNLEEIEFERGRAIGIEVMECFASEMNGLEAKGRALVADPGDPGAIFRARLGLLDRGLAEIDRVTDQIGWLMDGNVPDEIVATFAGLRSTLEQTRRNVEIELIQAVAQLN
jgi:hypothetical protein